MNPTQTLAAASAPISRPLRTGYRPRQSTRPRLRDGSLLRYLTESRGAKGYGVEIADEKILACIQNGVNVIQTDLEAACPVSNRIRSTSWCCRKPYRQ